MRIGVPARKHHVPDEHITHAVRNAIRRVETDEELTMLIGPAPDGALLEVGVLDLDGDDRSSSTPCRYERRSIDS